MTDRPGRTRLFGVRLAPGREVDPLLAVAARFAFAILLVLLNWGLVVLESGDYRDAVDGHVSPVDALYYTTVTLSTTGYGDIVPATERARLINALVVTPMRLLFVVVLVGTTIQALTERSRTRFRLRRWRRRMSGHVVVCGYGTKGRNAARALLIRGLAKERVVVVDADAAALQDASDDGFTTVAGLATRTSVLEAALVGRAETVVLALGRDDTAVLTTLAVRRLAPHATIVAVAREAGNGDLLRQSGATSVIVSNETAGRMLGLAADSPDTVDVVQDLLSFGSGLDLTERDVTPQEVGGSPWQLVPPVLAVIREHRRLYYDDGEAHELREGDRLVAAIVHRPGTDPRTAPMPGEPPA